MTFTSTPPTTTGFYAWKAREDISDEDVRGRRLIVLKKCTFKGVVDELSYEEPSEIKGLWCRLVPAEELEKAYAEGHYHCSSEIIESYEQFRANQAVELRAENEKLRQVVDDALNYCLGDLQYNHQDIEHLIQLLKK